MGDPARISADLTFSVSPADGGSTVEGSLRGEGSRLELRLSDPRALAGSGSLGAVRQLAAGLARRGVTLRVVGPEGGLVTLGARAPGSRAPAWWHRRLTGSRHVRIEQLRAVRAVLGRGAPVLPEEPLVPPATPLPLLPTLFRRPRRPVTTTHDPAHGGWPRLVAPPGHWPWDEQPVHDLRPGVTRIGSHPDNDIRLEGLADFHAEVVRSAEDEYVFVQRSRVEPSRVNGEPVRERILRTSSRIEMGPHVFSYYREEYADHGRPYGGRVGGEIGHQRPQPPLSAMVDPTEPGEPRHPSDPEASHPDRAQGEDR